MTKRYGQSRQNYFIFLGIAEDLIPDDAVSTERAAGQLRTRGYLATVGKLDGLIRTGLIQKSDDSRRQARWTPDLIEQAADHFEEQLEFGPLVAFLHENALTHDDYDTALMAEYNATVDEFGSAAFNILTNRPNEDHYVMHLHPYRQDKPATITFTLCDDIRQQIKDAIANPRKSRRTQALEDAGWQTGE